MSNLRWDAKRDTAEPDIVDCLLKAGARVWKLTSPLDLLVLWGGRFHLLECKTTKRVRKDQVKQTALIRELQSIGAPVAVVRNGVEALHAIGAIH